MASQVDIVNRSLLSIGARATVSSLTEGSTESDAASILFTPTFEMLARTAWWNCLQKQEFLSLVQAAPGTPENVSGTTLPVPPQPWLYAYELPSDCLHARRVLPNLTTNTAPAPTPVSVSAPLSLPYAMAFKFQVAVGTNTSGQPIQVILCNLTQAQLVYTVNLPNPQFWDSGFQQAMVASLAAAFVPALALNMQLMQGQVAIAQRFINEARVQDGNEGVHSMDNTPDWLRVRGCGRTTNSGWDSAYAEFNVPGWNRF